MNIFQTNPTHPQHDKYKLLNESEYYRNAKNKLIELSEGFYDKDKKLNIEFQTTFHSSFWELYIHALLKDGGFIQNETYDRPDFIIDYPSKLLIEAVVANIKDGGEPEENRTVQDVINNLKRFDSNSEFSKFIDESIIRCSNAIMKKIKEYRKNYINCSWVNKETPYIIALSSYAQINYGKESIYSMFALLYGHYFFPENDTYAKKEFILKNNISKIDIGLFRNDAFSDVSAIIFSPNVTLGKLSALCKSDNTSDPAFVANIRYNHNGNYLWSEVSPEQKETLYDGVYIFHNPYAKNKIPNNIKFNEKIIQFNMNPDNHNDVFQSTTLNLPIMARYCTPEFLLSDASKKLIAIESMASYNNKEISDILETKNSIKNTLNSSKKNSITKEKRKKKRKDSKKARKITKNN